MKAIALVANTSWNLVHFRSSLAETLRMQGYRVLAVAPPGPYSDRLLAYPFSRYFPWTQLRGYGRNLFQEALAVAELRRLYAILRPDLALHFTIKPNMYGSWAAARLGIPSISTVTGLGYPFLHPEGINTWVPGLYRYALKGSSSVVFQNEDDRTLFLKKKDRGWRSDASDPGIRGRHPVFFASFGKSPHGGVFHFPLCRTPPSR